MYGVSRFLGSPGAKNLETSTNGVQQGASGKKENDKGVNDTEEKNKGVNNPASVQSNTRRSLSMGDLMAAVHLIAIDALNGRLEQHLKSLEQSNRRMSNMNAALAAFNAEKAKNAPSNPSKIMVDCVDEVTGDKIQLNAVQLMNAYIGGCTGNDANVTAAQWITAAEKMKNASDALGSTNQVEMTKMQRALNQVNEATSTLSTVTKKLSDMNEGVIRNF